MAKQSPRPKTTKAIPAALAHKLAARSDHREQQRAAQTPPRGGGQTRRPIRHQGR